MKDPTGPFSWHDVYRAVERSEERIVKRLDDLADDMDAKLDHAASEREAIRGRVSLLEQRNAIEEARTRGIATFSSIGLRVILLALAIGQFVLGAVIVLLN